MSREWPKELAPKPFGILIPAMALSRNGYQQALERLVVLDVTQERSVTDSAEMNFECPACKVKSLTDLFRFRTREKLFGLVTLKVTEETAIRCPACESSFRSSLSIPALGELGESKASSTFRIRISLPDKFLVWRDGHCLSVFQLARYFF